MGLGNINDYINENWHGGQIKGDFFNHPEMDIEQTPAVQRKVKKSIWDWKHTITRELMSGKHKHEILAKYKTIIDKFNIYNIVKGFLDNNDGVLGYFIVDVSSFDDRFTYDDVPDELKSCNLYAINSTELRQIINRSLISENDGSIDGFLNSNDSVDEQVYYLDEYTGLPCIDGWNGNESDDEDERLDKIADMFVGKQWMTLSEKKKFDKMQGKLPYLISIVRRAIAPKSNSNGKFDDDVNDFDVKEEQLQADSIRAFKDAQVNNIKENKIDKIDGVSIPDKVEIKKEVKKSDFRKDVDLNKPVKNVQVNNIKENKVDKIDGVSIPDKVNIKKQFKKSDFRKDVNVDKARKNQEVKEVKQMKLGQFHIDDMNYEEVEDMNKLKPSDYRQDIEVDSVNYEDFDDNLTELKKKDYKQDIQFDDYSEFVIDDVKDMKDDDFDYCKVYDSNVDIDQMFEEQSDKNDIEIDKPVEEYKVSNKYDWSW